MSKKLLIGIIVVIVGLMIATAILVNPVWATTPIEVALVGVLIYLVWMVRKRKTKIFHDQMEPKLAERRLKRLKTFLLVAGISFVVFIASIILDKEIFGDLPEKEVTVFAYTASFSIVLFVIATIRSLVIFLKGR